MAIETTPTTYAPAWVPEPKERGTWGILYSCIFTLTLCVWSAIHLNIPPRGEHWRQQSRRKTKWLFIAIFAPEVGLYSAWQQYYLARRFILELKNVYRKRMGVAIDPTTFWWEDTLQRVFDVVNALLDWFEGSGTDDSDGEETSTSRRAPLLQEVYGEWIRSRKERQREPPVIAEELNKLSLTYGFYVIMGGLTIDAKMLYDRDIPQRPRVVRRSDVLERNGNEKEIQQDASQNLEVPESSIPDDEQDSFYVALTARGVLELAQILPWKEFWSKFFVEEQFISDKSKADSLAKVLVILQVSWTLLNSLSRLALGYHTSVLEIHTLVHAVCAMIMYGLWWQKPLDIRDSTVAEVSTFTSESQEKLALMFMRSAGSAYPPYVNFKFPNQWGRGGFTNEPSSIFESMHGISEWPSKTYGCEAGLTCLDVSAVRKPGHPRLRSISTRDSDEQGSPSRVPGSPETPSFQAETGLGHAVSHRSSNYDQDDLEANIGLSNFAADDGVESSPAATITRSPPEGIKSVQRISTGEVLPTGIGPMPLITTAHLSKTYDLWKQTEYWVQKCCPWLTDAVQKREPETCNPVEVGSSVKDAVRLPFSISLIREASLYHKMTFDLSEKDLLRSNLAAGAFIAELESSGRPVGEFGVLPTAAETSQSEPSPELSQGDEISAENGHDQDGGSDRLQDNEERLTELATPTLLCLQTQIREPGNEAFFNLCGFCDRSKNLDLDALRSFGVNGSGHAKSFFSLMVYVVVSLISGVYAGIHLALWNHDFPSRAEALMWRISATALGAPSVLLVLVTIGAQLTLLCFCIGTADQWIGKSKTWLAIVAGARRCVHAYRRAWGGFGEGCEIATWILARSCVLAFEAFLDWIEALDAMSRKSLPRMVLWYGFCILVTSPAWIIGLAAMAVMAAIYLAGLAPGAAMTAAIPLYLFARVYIVVESFLSLRHVPAGVYENVSWAQYLPHM